MHGPNCESLHQCKETDNLCLGRRGVKRVSSGRKVGWCRLALGGWSQSDLVIMARSDLIRHHGCPTLFALLQMITLIGGTVEVVTILNIGQSFANSGRYNFISLLTDWYLLRIFRKFRTYMYLITINSQINETSGKA